MNTEEIKNTIIQNYLHGAFHETNIEAFQHIFHPDFAILTPPENDKLLLFTRDDWQTVLEKRKNDPSFDYSSIALVPHFRTIDVEKDKASVSLDLYLADKLVYTDFLLLMRLDYRWQIVSKVYHHHT